MPSILNLVIQIVHQWFINRWTSIVQLYEAHAAWSVRQDWISQAALWIVLAPVFAIDVWLVNNGHTSISAWIWAEEAAHPTIQTAGVLALCYVMWLVRGYWPSAAFVGVMLGHLFAHW